MTMTRQSALSGSFHRLIESGSLAARDDADLLDRFVEFGDEFAFETIVRRHGPRVLGICRRILRDSHDADDAFQAVFLVLVRRSSSIRNVADLGRWLGGVAARTSRKIRAISGRRRAREASNPIESASGFSGPQPDAELSGEVEDELARLPEKYRDPIVLCLLEGKSRREAALRLGLAEGTVSSRISRGKALLGCRLSRRDIASTASMPMAISARLLRLTLRAAQDAAALKIAEGGTSALVVFGKGFLRMLIHRKFEVVAALVMALATIGAGSGFGQSPSPQPVEEPKAAAETKPAEFDARLKPIQGVWYLVGIKFEAKDKDGKPVETKIDLENQAIGFDTDEDKDSEFYGRAFQRATSFGVVKLVIDGDRVAYMIGDIEYVSSMKVDRGDKDLEVTLHQLAQGLVGGKKTPEMALVPRTPPPAPVGEPKDNLVKVRLEGDQLSWIQPLNQGVAAGEFPVQAGGVMLANNMLFRKLSGPQFDIDGYLRRMEPELHPERHPKREVADEPAPSIDRTEFEAEAKALEGTWVEVSMGVRGQFMPMIPGSGGGLVIQVDGSDSVRIKEGDSAPVSLRYRIDTTTDPRSIDFFRNRPGSDRVEVVRGLYRVNGELMTLAISDYPELRPKGLSAGQEDPQNLVILRRIDGPASRK